MAETTGNYTLKVIGESNDFEFVKGLFSLFEDNIIGETNILSCQEAGNRQLEVEVDSVSLRTIISTVQIIENIMKNNCLKFDLILTDGFIDNDYENYTLFEMKYMNGRLEMKTVDYSVEDDEETEDIMETRDAAYDIAKEKLEQESFKSVDMNSEYSYDVDEDIEDIEDDIAELLEECYAEEDEDEDDDWDEEDEED